MPQELQLSKGGQLLLLLLLRPAASVSCHTHHDAVASYAGQPSPRPHPEAAVLLAVLAVLVVVLWILWMRGSATQWIFWLTLGTQRMLALHYTLLISSRSPNHNRSHRGRLRQPLQLAIALAMAMAMVAAEATATG